MKISIAQFNPTLGDIEGNAKRIVEWHAKASADGAELVVFPELALIGYPPEDLILSPAFRAKTMQVANELAAITSKGAALLFGTLWEEEGHIYNAALLCDGGAIVHHQYKLDLPNYGIFDEKRVFTAGQYVSPFHLRGHTLGVLICEDIWSEGKAQLLGEAGAEIIITLNASPFESGKIHTRHTVVAAAAKAANVPVMYVNMVGGQDDIVFDGGSFTCDANGAVTQSLPQFEEVLSVILSDSEGSPSAAGDSSPPAQNDMWELWQAMQLGLKDYTRKNGFSGVLLGISGGIDSALSAACAVDALGADNVFGVLLPSPYTAQESIDDALALASNLGIETQTIPLKRAMNMFEETLNPVFKDTNWMEDVSVGGNLQARLRGVLLMALSNKTGRMLLSTGNKSEIAVGYSTLYGDACGGYNVLKDLYKTQVYELARWRNSPSCHPALVAGSGANKTRPRNECGVTNPIPIRSITRAPSAELAPGQLDQDHLPDYDLLDDILFHHIEQRLGQDELEAKGFDAQTVAKIIRLVRINEYKRRQSAPGVKLSSMLFSKDRRYPMTTKF